MTTTPISTHFNSPAITDTETPSTSPPAGSTLGYEAFLKLLIAQMQNQDPLQPMESSDYVAQLATFSQVEKSVEMNEKVSTLLTVARLQQAEGIIGKTVTTSDGQISGEVVSSRVSGDQVIAVLAGGREVPITDDITISGGKA